MYELIQIGDRSYYIDCPSRIGVVKLSDSEVCLIDCGNDRSVGKKIKKILDGAGWTPRSIYLTHSHGDHIGGCSYLAQTTGCDIYASGIEAAYVNHTVLEPILLWGAIPMSALKSKFLMAEASPARPLGEANLPECISVINLAGHSPDMVGYLIDDGVAFIGDAITPTHTLEKYKIAFTYDPAGFLRSLDTLEGLNAKTFLPSHAAPTNDLSEIIEENRSGVRFVSELILGLCPTPRSAEQIIDGVFSTLGITATVEQYGLIGSTVRSYLSYLTDSGALSLSIVDNSPKWIKI